MCMNPKVPALFSMTRKFLFLFKNKLNYFGPPAILIVEGLIVHEKKLEGWRHFETNPKKIFSTSMMCLISYFSNSSISTCSFLPMVFFRFHLLQFFNVVSNHWSWYSKRFWCSQRSHFFVLNRPKCTLKTWRAFFSRLLESYVRARKQEIRRI